MMDGFITVSRADTSLRLRRFSSWTTSLEPVTTRAASMQYTVVL